MRKFSLFVAGATVLAAASAYRAFFDLFAYFAQYDDTGAMLALIQCFNERGGLYGEVFSAYGPFCSEYYLFVGRILSVPITHDGLRWLVLVLWVGCSLAGSVIAYRLTRRIWVALLVQALSFHMLHGLIAEPGHPVSLVAALVAALALVLNSPRGNKPGRVQAILAGTILGMLCMTKINLGLFAVAAAGTAWVYCSPRDGWGRALRWIAAFLFCSFAVVLVKPVWPPEIRIVFLTVFLCTLMAVLVSAPGGKMEWRVLGCFGGWALAALLASVALSLSGALVSGTGWADLLDGLIVEPMTLGGALIVLPEMGRQDAVIALASFIVACAWRFFAPAFPLLQQRISLVLRLVFMGLITAWAMERCTPWTALAFLWIAALPPLSGADQNESDADRFGRLSLVLLAVGQLLGIYPVSGAQLAIPSYLAALCVIPVLHALFLNFERANLFRRHPLLKSAVAIAVFIGPSLPLAKVYAGHVRLLAGTYSKRTPLGLPGTNLLRIDRADAATYRCLAENLRNCRPTFVSLPAQNSLYVWAERPFPTGFNVPPNFAVLSTEEQRRIVEVGRKCKPLALILHQSLLDDFYVRGRYQPSGPLIDFWKEECRLAGHVRGYDFMSLKNEPVPTLTYCATLDADSQPGESNRITVTLPLGFGKVTTASVLDLSAPESRKSPLRLEERTRTRNEPIAGESVRQFAFVNPDPANLTLGTQDGFLVQLWDETGQLVADLPFALLPE